MNTNKDDQVLERMWPLYFTDSEFQPQGNGIVEVARQYANFFGQPEGAELIQNVSTLLLLLILTVLPPPIVCMPAH